MLVKSEDLINAFAHRTIGPVFVEVVTRGVGYNLLRLIGQGWEFEVKLHTYHPPGVLGVFNHSLALASYESLGLIDVHVAETGLRVGPLLWPHARNGQCWV